MKKQHRKIIQLQSDMVKRAARRKAKQVFAVIPPSYYIFDSSGHLVKAQTKNELIKEVKDNRALSQARFGKISENHIYAAIANASPNRTASAFRKTKDFTCRETTIRPKPMGEVIGLWSERISIGSALIKGFAKQIKPSFPSDNGFINKLRIHYPN